MRRVVVTGFGVVSSIGNNNDEVLDSLLNTKSGIVFSEEYKNYGFRSQVCGSIKLNLDEVLERKEKRFMGDGSAYAYIAMKEAIKNSGLEEKDISNIKTGPRLLHFFHGHKELSLGVVGKFRLTIEGIVVYLIFKLNYGSHNDFKLIYLSFIYYLSIDAPNSSFISN